MTWTLILIIWGNLSGVTSQTIYGFTSYKDCVAAYNEIRKNDPNGSHSGTCIEQVKGNR
jgi:hypothetical protein